MTSREAQCACGALRARAMGDPARLSICHCGACKRRTGSAFAWNATYPADAVTMAGASTAFARDSEDGFWVRSHFCPVCGVTLCYEIERRPGMISIPAGVFSDAGFPASDVEVYAELACPWLPALGLRQE